MTFPSVIARNAERAAAKEDRRQRIAVRDATILRLRKAGNKTEYIAAEVHLSAMRVQQICSKFVAEGLL